MSQTSSLMRLISRALYSFPGHLFRRPGVALTGGESGDPSIASFGTKTQDELATGHRGGHSDCLPHRLSQRRKDGLPACMRGWSSPMKAILK
jgi:hypothetical protein